MTQVAERNAQDLLDTVWSPGWGEFRKPVDAVAIAHELGIQVYFAGLERDVFGMLVKRPGDDPAIYLNGLDSENRQRFTCAHELGHYDLRVTPGDAGPTGEDDWSYIDRRSSLSSTGDDPEERYANLFAASLLMPRPEVLRLADQHSVTSLAYLFGVSAEAMGYRLNYLR